MKIGHCQLCIEITLTDSLKGQCLKSSDMTSQYPYTLMFQDIELILIALRSAGFILRLVIRKMFFNLETLFNNFMFRKDDPLEMKNLILKIQNKATVSIGINLYLTLNY